MFERLTVSGGHLNTNIGQGTRILIKWRGPLVTFRTSGAILSFRILQEIDAGYFPYAVWIIYYKSFERSIPLDQEEKEFLWQKRRASSALTTWLEKNIWSPSKFILNAISWFPVATVIRLWLSLEVETSICFCICCCSKKIRTFYLLCWLFLL